MTPTIYRYRRPGARYWEWDPLVVEESWYAARARVRVMLQCDNPEVEYTGIEPPLPDLVPPPTRKPKRRKRPNIKSEHKRRARSVPGFNELRKKAIKGQR